MARVNCRTPASLDTAFQPIPRWTHSSVINRYNSIVVLFAALWYSTPLVWHWHHLGLIITYCMYNLTISLPVQHLQQRNNQDYQHFCDLSPNAAPNCITATLAMQQHNNQHHAHFCNLSPNVAPNSISGTLALHQRSSHPCCWWLPAVHQRIYQ